MKQGSLSLYSNSDLEFSSNLERIVETLRGLGTFKRVCLEERFMKKTYLEGSKNRFYR